MTATTTTTTTPAYVSFCNALVKACQDQGLPAPLSAPTESGLPQNEGYCFLRFTEGGAALIIPKGKGRMGNLHSHVDLVGQDGYVTLPKKNGRVICHFLPDLAKVATVLHLFVGAAKRPVATPVKAQPVASQPEAAILSYTEEELEAEFGNQVLTQAS